MHLPSCYIECMGTAEPMYISYHTSAHLLDQNLSRVIKFNSVCEQPTTQLSSPNWSCLLHFSFSIPYTVLMNFFTQHPLLSYSTVVYISCAYTFYLISVRIKVQNGQENRQTMKKKTKQRWSRLLTCYLLKHPSERLHCSIDNWKRKIIIQSIKHTNKNL